MAGLASTNVYTNKTLLGNWLDDRNAKAENVPEPYKPTVEERFLTTNKQTFPPPVQLSSPGHRKLLEPRNFRTEISKPERGVDAATQGGTQRAAAAAPAPSQWQTSYSAHFAPVQPPPRGAAAATAAAGAPVRYVGGKPVPDPATVYVPVRSTLSKGELTDNSASKPAPRPRRGPFTRYPEESGAGFGDQTWFKP